MSLKFKIAANTLVQIIGKIITAGVSFLITILIARNYGVSGFGEFTKIVTYVSLFYLIVDFGMNAVVLREMERTSTKRKAQNYFINLFVLRIVWALVLIFLALAILVFLPYNPLTLQGFTPFSKLGIIVLLPTIFTQAIFVSCNALFQKNLRYEKAVAAASISSFWTLLFIFFFIKIKASLLLIIASYLFGGVITASLALLLSRSLPKRVAYLPGDRMSSKLLFCWRIFQKALPLGLTLIFNLIYFRADILILTLLRPTEEVGIYGLASKFFEFPLTIPTFFMNAVYPVLLKKSNNEEREQWNNIIKKSALFLLLASAILLLASLFLAPYLTLIKQDFAASIFPFRILSLSLPLFFLSSLFMWVLIAQGRQWLLAKIYGFVMIINILLNLFFIPRFGYNAAALTTGASEFIVLLLTGRAMIKDGT